MLNAYYFYKLSNWLYRYKIPVLPVICKLAIFLIYNSSIPYQARIEKGTKFAYGGIGVIIHKKAIIGRNCTIGSNVTIGGRSGNESLPIIGNNVYIATGAKILGPVKIGDFATIGANAVVINDVPDYGVAVGVPAKVIKTNEGK